MTTQTWQIELLTPLHLGDGEEMHQNLDYIQSGKDICVIDVDRMLRILSDTPGAQAEFDHAEFKLHRLIEQYKIPDKDVTRYRLSWSGGNGAPRSFRRFLQNAHGHPYVPGSSLKGAVRTALWKTLAPAGLTGANRPDFQNKVRELSGENPHHDFLRPFRISDTVSVDPDASLELNAVKIFNLYGTDQPGWRRVERPQTAPRHEQVNAFFVECLKAGTRLAARVELSDFLNDLLRDRRSSIAIKTPEGLADMNALLGAVNAHSLQMVRDELDFFRRFEGIRPICRFYEGLEEKIKAAASRGEAVFRAAWGGGWRQMTGNWMDERDLDTIRPQKGLGKFVCPDCGETAGFNRRKGLFFCRNNNCRRRDLHDARMYPVFPKSRRFLIKDGFPHVTTGWILVRPDNGSVFVRMAEGITVSGEEAEAKPAPVAEAAPDSEPRDPEADRQEKIDQFEQVLAQTRNLPGEIDGFISQIRNISDRELQQRMAGMLLERAKKMPKKNRFDKALEAGKKWAQNLKALVEEVSADSG